MEAPLFAPWKVYFRSKPIKLNESSSKRHEHISKRVLKCAMNIKVVCVAVISLVGRCFDYWLSPWVLEHKSRSVRASANEIWCWIFNWINSILKLCFTNIILKCRFCKNFNVFKTHSNQITKNLIKYQNLPKPRQWLKCWTLWANVSPHQTSVESFGKCEWL